MLFAFDMFGTLADPSSVRRELEPLVAGAAGKVAADWRRLQLEYMFRVTAMGQFPDFADLTRWALSAALASQGVEPAAEDLERLTSAYSRLACYSDVIPALGDLAAAGHQAVVFSVGPIRWLEELAAPYRHLLSSLVSAEAAGVYKPHPDIYRHLLRVTEAEPAQVRLVSGNPFDLIGGAAVGLGTVWCRRDPAARFDPWGTRPHHTVGSLDELATLPGATVPPPPELP
jgi:2-haloacid dehalogenase